MVRIYTIIACGALIIMIAGLFSGCGRNDGFNYGHEAVKHTRTP